MITIYNPVTRARVPVVDPAFVELRDAQGLLCGIIWRVGLEIKLASRGQPAFEEYLKTFNDARTYSPTCSPSETS